jgi:hypothetical protein
MKYYSPNNLPLSRDSNPRIREYEFTLTNETAAFDSMLFLLFLYFYYSNSDIWEHETLLQNRVPKLDCGLLVPFFIVAVVR